MRNPTDTKSARILDLAIVLIATLAVSWMWVETARNASLQRLNAIAIAEKVNTNLVRTLEEHTLRTLNSVDQLALMIKHEYERQGTRFDLADYFEAARLERDLFLSGMVINERGQSILGSVSLNADMDMSDREHFKVHQSEDSGKPFISKPLGIKQ